MDPCPNTEELQRFRNDVLDRDAARRIWEHVAVCPACRERIELPHESAPDNDRRLSASDMGSASDFLNDLARDADDLTITPSTFQAMTLSASGPATNLSLEWPVIADYEILEEIGRGGIGVVYKARQISLQRMVALKMLLAGAGASEMIKARFRTEAEAVARLQHVNIVQIFSIAEHASRPFLALELVEGITLAHQLNRGPQAPTTAASLVETLARAIHVAHERGIIHRDLKPSNILLPTDQDPLGTPKITDFGLAKLLDGDECLTRTGDIMGTPCYMAPEQALAGARSSRTRKSVGPGADVYSLGAILYEMLTGKPPFKAKTTVETLLQVLNDDPVSPSRLQPAVPQDLTTICLKCLEKEPQKRYGSALALADDLQRFLEGEPVRARRVGPAGLLGRWAKRRPGLAIMAAMLMISLIGGLLGMTRLWLRAEEHRRVAIASSERAESSLYFSRTARAQLAWRLNDPAATISLLDDCVPVRDRPDRRGWEWHYLRSLTASELVAFGTGSEYAMELGFSNDGRQLIVAGGNPFFKPTPLGKLRVWDVAPNPKCRTPFLVNALEEPAGMIRTFAATADGRQIAFASTGSSVKIWDVPNWRERRTLCGDSGGGPITGLALSPNGELLASIDRAGTLTVWNVETGTARFQAQAARARFTPDGSRLITVGRSEADPAGHPIVLDAARGRECARLPFVTSSFELSPDGRMMVIWSGFSARVADVSSGQVVASLDSHGAQITDAAFSPDGLHVATASADQTARVSDARTGAEELILRGHMVGVGSVAFHPSGRYLATSDKIGETVKIWDLSRRPEYATAGGATRYPSNRRKGYSSRAVLAMTFSTDGKELLTVGADGSVLASDARGGPRVRTMQVVPLNGQWLVPARVAAFSANGRMLAGVDRVQKNLVKVWDTSTGQEQLTLRGHGFQVFHVAGSRDATRWATASLDWKKTNRMREVKVWDAATGRLIADFHPASDPRSPRYIYGVVALSPDGDRVAFDDYADHAGSASTEATSPLRIKVFRISDGRELFSLPGHAGALTALTFSSDGTRLAAGFFDGLVMLHQLASGQTAPVRRLQGPPMSLSSVAFSPDDRLLAASDREQVQLWHVPTGEDVIVLRGAPPRIGDNGFNPLATWSPDGRRLAAFNHDHTVSVWDCAGDESVAERFAVAEGRAFAWHLAHVQAALWDPELRFAAEFHLRALTGLVPDSESLRLDYGIVCAWMGRWREAADQFREAHSQHPFEFIGQTRDFGLLLRQVGDEPEWQTLCAYARRRFGLTHDTDEAENLARLLLLAPDAVDPERLLKWSELACNHQMPRAITLLLRAGARYRNGQYREALKTVDDSADLQQHNIRSPALAAILAMAHARLGEMEQASASIDRADQWLADQDRTTAENPMATIPRSVEWNEWIEARILVAEAKSVVKSAAKMRSRAACGSM